jgi:hypothetical protein
MVFGLLAVRVALHNLMRHARMQARRAIHGWQLSFRIPLSP